MGALLAELIPSAIGLALTPAAIAACILFLGSRRPIVNASAFSAGFLVVYAFIAALVLVESSAATGPLISPHTKALITTAVGGVLLAVGVVVAIRRPADRHARPKWMGTVESASPFGAFGLGVALALLNPNVPILIGGLAVIASAHVSELDRLLAVVVLIAASQLGIAGPIAAYAVRPEWATRKLDAVKTWILTHARALNLGVLFVFGALFALVGISGL